MEAKFVKSLATDKTYVEAQARIQDTRLHVQVPGPTGNRAYGFAADALGVTTEILEWIDTLPHTARSMVSDAPYVPIRVRPYTDEIVHIQIKADVPAPGEASRDYGGAFNVRAPDLAKYLNKVLEGHEEAKGFWDAP